MEIPLYQDGQWTTCTHVLADDISGDYEDLMQLAGYSRATQFHPGGDDRSVTLVVWADHADPSRPLQRAVAGSPKYLVDVEFAPAGATETVAAAGIVDLMNLLAIWTPVVQVALSCDEALKAVTAEQDRHRF